MAASAFLQKRALMERKRTGLTSEKDEKQTLSSPFLRQRAAAEREYAAMAQAARERERAARQKPRDPMEYGARVLAESLSAKGGQGRNRAGLAAEDARVKAAAMAENGARSGGGRAVGKDRDAYDARVRAAYAERRADREQIEREIASVRAALPSYEAALRQNPASPTAKNAVKAAQGRIAELEQQRLDGAKRNTFGEELRAATVDSAAAGYQNAARAKAIGEALISGRADRADALLKTKSSVPDVQSGVGQAVSNAAQLLGQMGRQYTDPKAVTTGLAAAGAAVAAGQMGPQALLPEELVTAPAAFLHGIGAVGAADNALIEAGFAYEEMLELGIDKELARKISLSVGGVNGLLEAVQFGKVADIYKKLAGKGSAAAGGIGRVLKDWGKNVASETAQEVAQEASTVAGVQAANRLDKGEWAYTAPEVLGRLKDTAVSSALSFGLVGAPAAAIGTARAVRQGGTAQTARGGRNAQGQGTYTPGRDSGAQGGFGQNTAAPDVGTAEVDASVVQKIRKAIPTMQSGQPVANITGSELPQGGKIVDRLVQFANSFGNKINRPGFGDVLFSRGKIKNSMLGHGVGNAKIETFAAVPSVIQNGSQIDFQSQWKGRLYDTYLFAAPILYRGKQTYLGVVVQKDAVSNRYYLHEVVDEDGNLIYKNKEAPVSASDGTSALAGDLDTVADTETSSDAGPSRAPSEGPNGNPSVHTSSRDDASANNPASAEGPYVPDETSFPKQNARSEHTSPSEPSIPQRAANSQGESGKAIGVSQAGWDALSRGAQTARGGRNATGQGTYTPGRDSGAQGVFGQNTAAPGEGTAEHIAQGMTDDARAAILQDKTIKPVAVQEGALTEGESAALETRYKKEAKPLLRRIAEKFGIFKSYQNQDVNLEFNYSGRSFDESVYKQKKRYGDLGKALSSLDGLIESAVAIEAHGDRYAGTERGNADLANTYVMLSAYRDGDAIVPVKIVAKEFKGKDNKIHLAITLERTEAGVFTQASPADSGNPDRALPASESGISAQTGPANGGNLYNAPPASEISVTELIQKINPNDVELLKYVPASMLTEEQRQSIGTAPQTAENGPVAGFYARDGKTPENRANADPGAANAAYAKLARGEALSEAEAARIQGDQGAMAALRAQGYAIGGDPAAQRAAIKAIARGELSASNPVQEAENSSATELNSQARARARAAMEAGPTKAGGAVPDLDAVQSPEYYGGKWAGLLRTTESGKRHGAEAGAVRQAAELSHLFHVPVEFYSGGPERGYFEKGVIYINAGSKSVASDVFFHELTHYVEQGGMSHTDFMNAVLGSRAFQEFLEEYGLTLDEYAAEVAAAYEARGVDLDEAGVGREMAAIFTEKFLFRDEKSILSLAQSDEGLFSRIRAYLSYAVKKLKGNSFDKEILKLQRLYEKAYRAAKNAPAKDSGRSYSFEGYDKSTGKGIYQGNFPKGTPKSAKAARILELIQNVWSKKPLDLVIHEVNGTERTIQAQFDPTYESSGNVPTDAAKLMVGNRHGTSAEQRVTLDLADDYYKIASDSQYNYSKPESGKDSATHQGVKQWHYFINDILFQEHGQKEMAPYRVTINVKERNDGHFVYSFSAEKQEKRLSTRRTLHADVNQSGTTEKANAQPSSNTSKAQDLPGVNRYDMSPSEKDAQKSGTVRQYSINPNFESAYDNWVNRLGRRNDVRLKVGRTSEALKSIGVKDQDIFWDSSKINDTLNKHAYMSDEIIKQVPQILERPVIVMQSKGFQSRITMFGEVYDGDGLPILAVLELTPNNKAHTVTLDEIRVASTHSRKTASAPSSMAQTQSLIDSSKILYLDPNKNRTSAWFASNRLQLPFDKTKFGPIDKVSYPDDSVNTQDMQNAGKDAQKSVLAPEDIARRAAARKGLTPKGPEAGANKQSGFLENVRKSGIVDPAFVSRVEADPRATMYKSVANEDTMVKAAVDLEENWERAIPRLLNKPATAATAEDVAKGFILLHRFQAAGDYDSALTVVQRLREMGTKAGQTVQAFSILGRLTPEGMTVYAQRELDNLFYKMKEIKTQGWMEANKDRFRLNREDMAFIRQRVAEAARLPEGRDKNILLAEISARIQDKVPPTADKSLKAWIRVSLLLNPRTNIRNVLGNAVIMPMHVVSDFVGAGLDRALSAKTGVRTTGMYDPKSVKGMAKGAYESFDDFRRRINTRDVGGDRFEIGEGPSFSKDRALGRALNALDRTTSFLLDLGDRPFYEMWFVNSLNNQMKLNGVSEATAEMIDIARGEALERTWQDVNAVTRSLSNMRSALNFGKKFGLGNLVFTFTKTPANLTKAMVDFSPLGLGYLLGVESRQFYSAVQNGTATAAMQKAFVNRMGKAVAGTIGMGVFALLAAAGKITGAGDEDRDAAAFQKDVLGVRPYSIRIGKTTYTYDWAQPVASAMAAAADVVQNLRQGREAWGDKNLSSTGNAILQAMEAGGSVLFRQSVYKGLSELFQNDGVMGGLVRAAMDLPSMLTPTVLQQMAQMGDPVARSSYESGDYVGTAINQVRAKLPGARQTLAPQVDVLGREVAARTDVFSVMLNPANQSTAKPTAAAEEIWRLYEATGDKGVFPRRAPYSFTRGDERYRMTSHERADYQKVAGGMAEAGVSELIVNPYYSLLSDEDKAEVLKDLYGYGEAKAKEGLGFPVSSVYEKAAMAEEKGISPAAYYLYRATADADLSGGVTREEAEAAIDAMDLTMEQKAYLWALQNAGWGPEGNPYRAGYRIAGYSKR